MNDTISRRTMLCILSGNHYNPGEILITNDTNLNKQSSIPVGIKVYVIKCDYCLDYEPYHPMIIVKRIEDNKNDNFFSSEMETVTRRFDRIKNG